MAEEEKKKKKPFYKKWWGWLIVTLLAIGIFGSRGGDEVADGPEKVESEETEEGTEEESEEEKEEDVENTEFGVGDKVKLDGQGVEVTEVEKSQGDDFETPSEGNEFVIVHVAIENNGEDEISYNPFNFKMKNSDGQIEDEGMLMVDSDTSLSSGDLAPGGNVSGTLSFEQPNDDDGLELIFETGFWGTDEVVFNLSK